MTTANDLKPGETTVEGIVTVERLFTGYYSFAWSGVRSDFTELVHPWNVKDRLAAINA